MPLVALMAAISSRDYSSMPCDASGSGPERPGWRRARAAPGPRRRWAQGVLRACLLGGVEEATFAQTRVPPGKNGQREVCGIIWAFKICGYRDDTRQSTAR